MKVYFMLNLIIHITYEYMINISIFLYWLNLKIFDSSENEMCIYLWTEGVVLSNQDV